MNNPEPSREAPRAPASGVRPLGRGLRFVLGGHFVGVLTVLLFLVLWPLAPRIASARNLENLLANIWPLLALVLGQMFVLLVGGIDLSQTSIMAVASVVGGCLMTSRLDPDLFAQNPLWGVVLWADGGPLGGSAWAVPGGVGAMLAVGLVIGLSNGVAVARLKMPAFMVTLVSMLFLSGLAVCITRSENIRHLPAAFVAIGRGQVGPLPWSMFLVGGLAVLAHAFLVRTVPGRWFYAAGTNARAAAVSGVPAGRVVIAAYALSGFCAAAAGVLYSARLECGRPTLGDGQLLDIIGAAVIGGISLFGGKGSVLGALLGVLFLALLTNALNMLHLRFHTVYVVKGGVILLAAVLDTVRARLLAQRPLD